MNSWYVHAMYSALSLTPLTLHVCLHLCVSFSADISSCFYMAESLFTGCLGLSLWFCKLVHLIFCFLAARFWIGECGFVFFQQAAFGVVVCFFFGDSGLLFRVICHFCVLLWFWIVCLCFVLIIMGCSLLLSHFLFIALILDPGLSLTSQGCLRCGNQGKLYLPGVSSHLLTSDLISQL